MPLIKILLSLLGLMASLIIVAYVVIYYGESILKKVRSIFTGWFYLAFKRDKVEDMANRRAKICAKCPYAKFSNIDVVWDKRIPSISGKHCQICGCSLPAKLRSAFESCPDDKWGEEKL